MAASKSKTSKLSQPAIPGRGDISKIVRSSALRLGIPILAVWIAVILIGHIAGFIIAGVLTLLAAGILGWALLQIRKSGKVADILRGVDMSTASGRKDAMSQLDAGAAKGDVTSIIAKAQLLMHEDPKKALEVLEQINLDKTMAPVADEVRGQRAMIHLLLGEVDRARSLADGIDLSRHQELKSRAALAAVISESWARTGQAKRASDTLDLFDPENDELTDMRPQLYRARAFAAAGTNDTKRMRLALRRLRGIEPQLLAGFVQRKVHPVLEKEARAMLMQSGVVPKKMVRQRM